MSAPPRPEPVRDDERIEALDALRGFALFGVLMVNLLTAFRVSFFQFLDQPHTHAGSANRAVDIALLVFLELKFLTLFSFLFGVGLAVQGERAARQGGGGGFSRRALRRLLVLLLLGLGHMFLVWNGDILALYAIAGLFVLPFARALERWGVALALVTAVLLWLPASPVLPADPLPRGEELARHAAEALPVYAHGGWVEIFAFRAREAVRYIAPLLAFTLPRAVGLMLLGVWVWRRGVFQRPSEHLPRLRWIAAIGLSAGVAANAAKVAALETGVPLGAWGRPLDVFGVLLLAFGYGAAFLLLLERPRARRWLLVLAPLGRTALTSYLAQSVVLGLVFYGYGLGLFGRLGAAAAAPIGLALYAAQVAVSAAWLRRFRFGPVEWVWRWLTYGRRPPMRRASASG